MPRRFALDQNFPEPIVNALAAWLRVDAELVPIRTIDLRMATIDDWQILHALHAADEPWDGLITTDARMLSLPKELALLCQTKLTLVVAEAVGHDPIKATVSSWPTSAPSASRQDRIELRCGVCGPTRGLRRIHGTS